jgi:hypothetical protein
MTIVYGYSDDLVEIEGDLDDEIGAYDQDIVITASDGTVLFVHYGKPDGGIWAIAAFRVGDKFLGIDECHDENADRYSDVARFADGLEWIVGGEKQCVVRP